MKTVKFYHFYNELMKAFALTRKTRGTLAFEEVTKKQLEGLLSLELKGLDLSVGIAYCSPKDVFNRKTGRELSQSRMKSYFFKLRSVEYIDDMTVYTLIANESFPYRIKTIRFKTWPNKNFVIPSY